MKTKIKSLIEEGLISEPEIVELVSVTYKLVKNGIIKEKKLSDLCDKLGVTKIDEKSFELEEGVEYTFNV